MADITANLTGAQKDAFAALNQIFSSYGLGTLAPRIVGFLKEGYSPDTIGLLLQETPEYRQRFAANDARRAKGLPVLSPAEYLATERSYRQIMQAAGLPVGFYDNQNDFKTFLENDVSPQEIQQRVTAAADFINQATPQEKAMYKQWYTDGDMIAFALDPKRAAPLVGKAFAASRIGGQAVAHGLDINQSYAEQVANAGFDSGQASQAFGVVEQNIANDQKLAALSGESISQQDLMNEIFFNNADVTQKRQKIGGQEQARFGGSTAVGAGSLGTSSAGQF